MCSSILPLSFSLGQHGYFCLLFGLFSTRAIISLFQGELFCLERIYSEIQIFLGKGADFKVVREKKYTVC